MNFFASSKLSVQFWDSRSLYWKVFFSGVSQIRRDCILCLLKCWDLSMISEKKSIFWFFSRIHFPVNILAWNLVGCCKRTKYTLTASLVGPVGGGWQKRGLNLKNHPKSVFFALLDPPPNILNFCDHHCKGKVFTDIFHVESLCRTYLLWAVWLFE